jgi:beta-lactamase class A
MMARFLRFVLFLIIILSLFPLYNRFREGAAPVAPGVHLAGMEMSRYKDVEEIERQIRARYQDPIAVYFGDQRIVLRPQDVEFEVDVDAMLAHAARYLGGEDFAEIAVRYLLGLSQRRRDVPTYYTYNPKELTRWLIMTAERHNRPPQASRALPPQWGWAESAPNEMLPAGFVGSVQADWQWTLGSPGQTLLVSESVQPILEALADPEARVAHLVLAEVAAPPLSMDDLSRALDNYTADFPGFAAIYVQDLATGEEAAVDVDVAFSGMSTMKIAIVTQAFRKLDGPADTLVGQWMDYALGESSNFAANQLLKWIGDGDIFTGGRRVTEMLRRLGLTNSYIQTGYDDKSKIAPIPTAANQRTDWNTNPDPHLQSTPEEMGRLLAEIYRCSQGTGNLLETFPGELTPDECLTILFYLSHDEFTQMVWAGLPRPEETWFVHKHGFVNEAHSDVALVWGPTGPYVITVYLWRRGWMNWDISNPTMQGISRITWNFFALRQQLDGTVPPDPPIFELPPNYIPVNTYESRAATNLRQRTGSNEVATDEQR